MPNIISVHPPSTASGSVASKAPKNGKIPAIIIIIAPVAIANLLTTLVMATRPTFWLKDVIGKHPKTEDKALMKPSQAIEPEVSFAVTSRFKPEAARAEVSPIVSVAETKKIKITEKIALALNSGLKGINEGTAIIEVPESEEKSTTPIITATIYPTISPNKTESCLKYDFAKILKIIHESNVIVPRIQFVAEPKFSLPLPPPKELAPTERREKPMEVTTLAATIGDISLIQYFAKRPRTPSTIPPTRTAPTMALYP